MKIQLSQDAVNWYKDELSLSNGDSVKFFARYGGCSNVQSGFSLGVLKDDPINPFANIKIDGIDFFVEESDAWYFDQKDLTVRFHSELHEPEFIVE